MLPAFAGSAPTGVPNCVDIIAQAKIKRVRLAIDQAKRTQESSSRTFPVLIMEIGLFDDSGRCTVRKSAFARLCHVCGAEAVAAAQAGLSQLPTSNGPFR